MGQNSSLSQTIYEFQCLGLMIGDGGWGSDVTGIGAAMEIRGYKAYSVGLNELNKPGVYIISFWNENPPVNGLHTVAVSYNGDNYSTYNLKGRGEVDNRNPNEYVGDRYIILRNSKIQKILLIFRRDIIMKEKNGAF